MKKVNKYTFKKNLPLTKQLENTKSDIVHIIGFFIALLLSDMPQFKNIKN